MNLGTITSAFKYSARLQPADTVLVCLERLQSLVHVCCCCCSSDNYVSSSSIFILHLNLQAATQSVEMLRTETSPVKSVICESLGAPKHVRQDLSCSTKS